MGKKILILISLVLISGCATQENLPTATLTATSTSTATATITSTPTVPVTPSPSPMPFEAFNLIYAYISEGSTSSEIHVIYDNTTRVFEFEGITSDDTLAGNLIAISPDGSKVVAEILRENIAKIFLIDLQQENLEASLLAELPANASAVRLGFSPKGRWLFVIYDAFGSGPFVIRSRLYDLSSGNYKQINNCQKILGFSIDENSVYCATTNTINSPKPIQYNLITSEQRPFFDIPSGKQFQVNQSLYFPVAFLFDRDQAIIEGNGQTLLMDNLVERGESAYWSADDIRNLPNQTVIANSQLNLKYLPEPKGNRSVITGVFSNSSGGDRTCIHTKTYSFLASPDQIYSPNPSGDWLNGIYALAWSPDGSAIVGIVFDEEKNCRLTIIDPITMDEITVIKDDLASIAKYWFNFVRGIDAVWLP